MSKSESILKQAEVFEKLALYGGRKEFLASIAQNLSNGAVAFPNENVSGALNSVVGAIKNLSSMLAERLQVSLPETGALSNIANLLSNSMYGASAVSSKNELDAKANPIKSLLGNAMSTAMKVGDMQEVDQESKEIALQVRSEAKKALTYINNFYRNNGIQLEDLSNPSQPSQPAAPAAAPAAPKQVAKANPTEAIKNLTKTLEASIDRLGTGPQRTAQLQKINAMVRTLQNYFTTSQKSGGLQEYFVRMEIVNALQKVYSALDYSDLETVTSLNAGQGVPETPDSRIA